MKIKTTVAALSVLSVLSFGAFAADTINAEQAQSRQAIGTVSVGAIGTSPGTLPQNCTNKPSSSCPTILPPVRGLFFALMTNIKTQMPFQLFLCLIKQQY